MVLSGSITANPAGSPKVSQRIYGVTAPKQPNAPQGRIITAARSGKATESKRRGKGKK